MSHAPEYCLFLTCAPRRKPATTAAALRRFSAVAARRPGLPTALHRQPCISGSGDVFIAGSTNTEPTAPSWHPALAALQLRFARRNNMNNWTHLKRKRRVGFLARIRTRLGRKILERRRARGRRFLSH